MSEEGSEYKKSCEYVVKVHLWAVDEECGRRYLARLFEEMERRGDISHFAIVREVKIGSGEGGRGQ